MSRNAWRLDRRLTAMMVEDMTFDPILGAKVLLNVRVPPHEELRFLWMWTTFYTNDDSGFSTGKSFTHAVIAALRSILFPGRVSGILSKTMEQGKLIFRNLDNWYENSPVFRWCISHHGKNPRLIHGSSAHQAFFRGGSEIRVLPPNFMQDAERLRSERWNDGYFDEWTTYGNFEALNKTLTGRVTRDNMYPDCLIRQNHIHLSSTPGFKHHPSYTQIRRINQHIASGNKDYSRFTVNYRHIPNTKKWRWMVARKTILVMQTSLPAGIVKSEIDGIWQDDSMSFYNSKEVWATRFGEPIVRPTDREREENSFVMGFDVARGGSGQAVVKQTGDDFSLSIFRIPHSNPRPVHCKTVRKYNITAPQMAAVVHEQNKIFHCGAIVCDAGGGGLFVCDELKKDTALINNRIEDVIPIVTLGDTTPFATAVLIPFRRNFYWIERAWGKMISESILVNRLHGSFVQGIQAKTVTLGKPWTGWENVGSQWDVDQKRSFLNSKPTMPDIDRVAAEMDLAVEQLIMVDVIRDENGMPILDSHGMYKFRSNSKKDSAYSLAYAYMGYLVISLAADHFRQQSQSSIASAISVSEINPYAPQ